MSRLGMNGSTVKSHRPVQLEIFIDDGNSGILNAFGTRGLGTGIELGSVTGRRVAIATCNDENELRTSVREFRKECLGTRLQHHFVKFASE